MSVDDDIQNKLMFSNLVLSLNIVIMIINKKSEM